MTKIAICQYQIEKLADWKSYTEKIESMIIKAKQRNVELLLMPEYAGTEIVCSYYATERELFSAMQPLLQKYIEFYKNLAKLHKIYIQPGTIVEEIASNQYVNRAYLFGPSGQYGYQDKLQLTEDEKNCNLLQKGKQQYLFDTSLGYVGIAICYDSEFPEIVRNLVRAGALLVLVPSYTVSIAGYNRVFQSCRARSIENQCYIAVSYVVNAVGLSAEVENTFGQAALLGPADNGFPDDGIIAQGLMNEVSLVTADLSYQDIAFVRSNGQVCNFEDSKCYDSIKNYAVNTINLLT